ncbi:Uncharacterised protein [Staphylococcus piscifermentans]|uniref:Uncharacterized protein n=2 Tax=Staphylococcus piscifermentans TaxID=70258 RepID=A0A239TM67_9STAP|nr:hypothetical protein SPI02_14430 [Staphylococcus piscifermentans]SNU98278.1 Uncharacterised protein [Staphylococcus piscifermentans]
METLEFQWTQSDAQQDPFYLTKIWNRFASFQPYHHQNLLLRKKKIRKRRPLSAGVTYHAELDCRSKRELKHMTHCRYQLTVADTEGIAIEIVTEFVVVTDTANKRDTAGVRAGAAQREARPDAEISHAHALQLNIEWPRVLQYLEDVEDDNPVHPETKIVPGDYIAMLILQYWEDAQTDSFSTEAKAITGGYKAIDLRFKQPMYASDTLVGEAEIEAGQLIVTVYNQFGTPCMVFQCR